MKLYEMSAHTLRDMLDRGDVSAVDITESVIERLEATEPSVGAYLTVTAEDMIEQAKAADATIKEKQDVHLLTGIPVAIKDNLCTEGVRTTCASKILDQFIPPYDATVVARLKAAGAPIVGKTNMDEFAMGSGTENSAYHPTKNPWDSDRVPGGSSGGSGAAVAAGSAIISLGSDTGGSIRLPAAHCGLVGLKPTYGVVSRFGLVPLASTLDTVGPIGKDVRDVAMMFSAIAGHDPRDTTSSKNATVDYVSSLDKRTDQGLKDVVIGVPNELFEYISPDVKEAVDRAIGVLQSLGARVQEVNLPHVVYSVATYRILVGAEASSALGRLDGVRFGYRDEQAADVATMFAETRRQGLGLEVKRRIMRGTYALSAARYEDAYVRSQRVRALIKNDFDEAFNACTFIVSPTAPTVAPLLGGKADGDESARYSDLLTVPVNLAGLPAISVPCGQSETGLPIGLQMIAPAFADESLLQAAYAYEQAAGISPLRPSLEVV